MDIIKQLTSELSLDLKQVENTVKLIDEGNTIPFIARYRKELTGELDDIVLRALSDRLTYLRNLQTRKEEVTRIIDEQGKLTDELVKAIEKAKTLTEIEDIYRPYKQKRRTRATIAKEKGLEPLAQIIYAQDIKDGSIEDVALPFVDVEKGVETFEDALNGAKDIIAELVSDNAEYRKYLREKMTKVSLIVSKATDSEKDSVYSMYYDFSEPVEKVANHRVLAMNRGEKEGFISVKIDFDEQIANNYLLSNTVKNTKSITSYLVSEATLDAYKRLICPSVENEVRNILTDNAQEASIKIFSKNLDALLLQPPIKGKVVLGFDPGFRTGCKVGVVDGTGKVLDTNVVYCTLEHHDKEKAKATLRQMLIKNDVDIVAIGNGTASKESEIFIVNLLKELDKTVYYVMVSEAGASVYSASELASKEFPEYDVSLRSAISIARRLQDPLAELVKIDPKAIGVGQYQHDMNQKRLGEALDAVVEDCVNRVGVDLNTASPSLLSYVAGVNGAIAKAIVEHREHEGQFNNRKQLLKVKKLGKKAFEQCAGFLRISNGANILDNTSVHPESYDAALKLIKILGYTLDDVLDGRITDIKERLSKANIQEVSEELGVGVITIRDIVDALLKKGRDPREELEQPILLTDVMGMEDLKTDMVLTGTVRNVIDFGAFVDIGVHQDGLVHISQISNKYIKHPIEVLSVGDIVKVKVLDVDAGKKRISLTMKF